MIIYPHIADISHKFKGNVVVLGTFDGIHIGHQEIICRAVDMAKKHHVKSIVFTFSNHPLEIIAPQKAPRRISDNALKEEEIRRLGIDILMNIPFTRELAQIPAKDFVQLLQQNLSPSLVIVGPNFTFGKDGLGTPQFLLEQGKKLGFAVEIAKAVFFEGSIASSTRVRAALKQGHIDLANAILGHPFTICGVVDHGKKRGRVLGIPTANLYFSDKYALPADGVYAVGCCIEGKYYEGIANVGNNPTFNDITRRIEVNIFDFNANIYDKNLTVFFKKHLRTEEKFPSIYELLAQMKRDILKAREFFRSEKES